MTDVIDDQEYFSVIVTTPPPAEGTGRIENLTYPSQVESNTPFEVSYDCFNDGETDDMWGHLMDTDAVTEIDGTHWNENIPGGSPKHVVHTFEGITTDLHVRVEAGHVE